MNDDIFVENTIPVMTWGDIFSGAGKKRRKETVEGNTIADVVNLTDIPNQPTVTGARVVNIELEKSSIVAGTITGGILQTALTGQKIVIDHTDNSITFYDSSGKKRGKIYGEYIQMFDSNEDLRGTLSAYTGGLTFGAGGQNLEITVGNDKAVIISTGSSTTDAYLLPAYSGRLHLGSSNKRIGTLHTNGYIYSWYSILPNTDPSYSSLGESTRYWQYLWVNYLRYKNMQTFQKHDDINLIKNVGTKTITRDKVIGYDKTKDPPVPIKQKETVEVWNIDTMPTEVKEEGFYDVGAVEGLIIGTLKQIIDRIEKIEDKISKINT